MTQMLKCTFRDPKGEITTIRTYVNDSTDPKELYASLLSKGYELISHEWIDTLTPERIKWNQAHPDLQIPLD